jgi:hypothetical protein
MSLLDPEPYEELVLARPDPQVIWLANGWLTGHPKILFGPPMVSRDNTSADKAPTQPSDDAGMDGALRALVGLLARQAANEALEAPLNEDVEPHGQSAQETGV